MIAESQLVQTGKIEREFALLLDDLQNARENSDYEVFIEATKNEAIEALESAKRFVERARVYLKNLA